MKQIIKLTKSELIKQLKKKSIVVMIALFMAVAIGIPVAGKIFNKSESSNLGGGMSVAQPADSGSITSGSSKEMVNNSILKAIESQGEITRKAKIVTSTDWRIEILDKYLSDYTSLLLLENLKDGVSIKDIEKYAESFVSEDIQKAATSKVDLDKYLLEYKNRVEQEKNIIANEDYLVYLKGKIEILEKEKKDLQKEKEAAKGNKEVENGLKYSIYTNEYKLELAKYRLENQIPFKQNEWKNETLLNIEELKEENGYEPMTKDVFEKSGGLKISYEEYLEQYQNKKIENEKQIEKDWYSLKNNIPQMKFVKDGRNIVMSSYDIFFILAIVMVVIIGGGIVASEFTTGSIRLLLIRPVNRWKILTGKLLALVVVAAGMVIAGIAILMIATGILYGFSDYNIKIIEIVNGNIILTGFYTMLIKNLVISVASLVFMISLVFFMTTVIKNTAVAVGVGIVIYLGVVPITLVLASLGITGVVSTPIPYINQSLMNLVPSLTSPLAENGAALNPQFGGIMLIVISIILLVASYVTFNKRDIKN